MNGDEIGAVACFVTAVLMLAWGIWRELNGAE